MTQSPCELFEYYLNKQDISPRKFSDLSGMPLTEVHGLLDGELPFTKLRAHHLSAVFNTEVDIWLQEDHQQKMSALSQ